MWKGWTEADVERLGLTLEYSFVPKMGKDIRDNRDPNELGSKLIEMSKDRNYTIRDVHDLLDAVSRS